MAAAAADAGPKPVVACFLGHSGTLDLLPGTAATNETEAADGADDAGASPARPLLRVPRGRGRGALRARWRTRSGAHDPKGVVPELSGVDEVAARALVDGYLSTLPPDRLDAGAWLDRRRQSGCAPASVSRS